ncbi:glucose-6-phosphate isomerase [Anaeramoeba ignava]|uniref:Glucose-6-phosphate isomerase n=1 Tax=Anaeramoeba ignava TaxID=1746090 RepID=A0A9Q0LK56_ANAIG|nr:glucose-6-phosphate isomerase [Anaeramoeba ignava]
MSFDLCFHDALTEDVFFDSDSGFTMNYYGAKLLNKKKVFNEFRYNVKHALEYIKRIENGELVNSTGVLEESENRAVDHFNLRMEEEVVKGKSLQKSIEVYNDIQEKVEEILSGKKTTSKGLKYTDIVFNGIGGSFLGPYMMIVSQYGADFNFTSNLPVKLHFISNTDPTSFALLLSELKIETTILVSISKSGTTAETVGNMFAFNKELEKKNLEIGEHNIGITTRDSWLHKYGLANKYLYTFHVENETGGRVSVCSAVGMVPMAFARINFIEFIKGQSHMDKLTRMEDPEKNPAMIVAIILQKITLESNHQNVVVLSYTDFLREYSHYLQQLYCESLGKEYDINGLLINHGQTVYGGVGTSEQHSFIQQIQKGIHNVIARFIYCRKRTTDYENQKAGTMGRQLLGFLKGTESALIRNNRPFITCTVESNSPFNMGMLIALEERVVAFLGAFRNLNPFDQPGVQDGKLASDFFNKFSKELIESIAKFFADPKAESFTGGANEALIQFMKIDTVQSSDILNQQLIIADTILSDIEANLFVSYPQLKDLISVSRSFDNSRFVYVIHHKDQN